MVFVVCMKLDGVRWPGSSEIINSLIDEVLRGCADMMQAPHKGQGL